MAFRSRPSYTLVGGFAAIEDVDQINEDGLTLRKKFNPHKEHLPPCDNYELDTLLKAGVPLQQTRSKFLAPNAVGVADALADLESSDFEQLEQNNTK